MGKIRMVVLMVVMAVVVVVVLRRRQRNVDIDVNFLLRARFVLVA